MVTCCCCFLTQPISDSWIMDFLPALSGFSLQHEASHHLDHGWKFTQQNLICTYKTRLSWGPFFGEFLRWSILGDPPFSKPFFPAGRRSSACWRGKPLVISFWSWSCASRISGTSLSVNVPFRYSHHPFRKENDLNQTSMRTCSMWIFRGEDIILRKQNHHPNLSSQSGISRRRSNERWVMWTTV